MTSDKGVLKLLLNWHLDWKIIKRIFYFLFWLDETFLSDDIMMIFKTGVNAQEILNMSFVKIKWVMLSGGGDGPFQMNAKSFVNNSLLSQ